MPCLRIYKHAQFGRLIFLLEIIPRLTRRSQPCSPSSALVPPHAIVPSPSASHQKAAHPPPAPALQAEAPASGCPVRSDETRLRKPSSGQTRCCARRLDRRDAG